MSRFRWWVYFQNIGALASSGGGPSPSTAGEPVGLLLVLTKAA